MICPAGRTSNKSSCEQAEKNIRIDSRALDDPHVPEPHQQPRPPKHDLMGQLNSQQVFI